MPNLSSNIRPSSGELGSLFFPPPSYFTLSIWTWALRIDQNHFLFCSFSCTSVLDSDEELQDIMKSLSFWFWFINIRHNGHKWNSLVPFEEVNIWNLLPLVKSAPFYLSLIHTFVVLIDSLYWGRSLNYDELFSTFDDGLFLIYLSIPGGALYR